MNHNTNNMNPFTKHWITATIAPESILNLREKDNIYLDAVRDEYNTKQLVILSNDNYIIGIGTSYDTLTESKSYSFSEGLQYIAEQLNICSISF